MRYPFICRSHLQAIAGVMLIAWFGICMAGMNWPAIAWPSDMQHFSIANTLVVQGMPLQIHGFTASDSPEDLVNLLQQQYGGQLVRTQGAADTIFLGKPEGNGYFINFRIKPAGNQLGSQGEASLTSLSPINAHVQQFETDKSWWMRHLPSGYQLIQHQVSIDPHEQALYLIVAAPFGISTIRRTLANTLALQGFQPESDLSTVKTNDGPLYFSADKRQATVYQSLHGQAKSAVLTLQQSVGSNNVSAIVNMVFTKRLADVE